MISSDGGGTKLALFEGQPSGPVEARTAAFHRVAFSVTGAGFTEFLGRLSDLGLTGSNNRAVTSESVVDHQQAYWIYFTDPYGHLLEVTTYDYDAVRRGR